MLKYLVCILCIFCPMHLYAWEGIDVESDASVEIEDGNLVRQGNDIEIYYTDTDEYKDVEVESINRYGDTVELEIYDYDTGDISTIEMYDY